MMRMRVQRWSILLCVVFLAGALSGAGGAQAASTGLPSVKPLQGGPMGGLTTTWALGDASGAIVPKPTVAHPLTALLTYSYLPYPSEMPQYTASTVLFGDGTSMILTPVRAVFEVARAKPSLYLVLGWMGNGNKAGWLGVLAIDTYGFTVKTVLHSTMTTDSSAVSCGVVFSAAGNQYTVRGTPAPGPSGADLSHALLKGAVTCS